MTTSEAKELFFYHLNQRVQQNKSAKSISKVMEIMCPEDLVYAMATGADTLCKRLGIGQYHQTNDKITYTLDGASNYSKNSIMPLWNEMNSLLNTAETMSNIGQGLDWAGYLPFGDILGKILGLKFKGGLRRGDYLIENLDKATNSLIEVAKYDFDNHIKKALIAEGFCSH